MPYIPTKHQAYDLLPSSRARGGEVFEYPATLFETEALLPHQERLIPYGYPSYQAYDAHLDALAKKYSSRLFAANNLPAQLAALKEEIHRLNIKENWPILQYTGKTTPGCFGLTRGRCYYVPRIGKDGHTLGIIDDEEFTSHSYLARQGEWLILEDPRGHVRDFFRRMEG